MHCASSAASHDARAGISTADSGERLLCDQFGTRDLDGFGCAALRSRGRRGGLSAPVCPRHPVRRPAPSARSDDRAARRGADPGRRDPAQPGDRPRVSSGRPEHTLAGVLDRTATAMGSRLLRRWLEPTAARHARRCNRASCRDRNPDRRRACTPTYSPSSAESGIWNASSRVSHYARHARGIWPRCAMR